MNNKVLTEHADAIGNKITIDSILAIARANTLIICKVLKINPKMLRVTPVSHTSRHREYLVYPADTILIDKEDATIYILKDGKRI